MVAAYPLSRGDIRPRFAPSRTLALAAIGAGLVTGIADLSGAPVLMTLALAVAGAFALAVTEPRHAWLWVVLQALGVLATQLADPTPAAGFDGRTGAALIAVLVVLLPAAVAAVLGALVARDRDFDQAYRLRAEKFAFPSWLRPSMACRGGTASDIFRHGSPRPRW